ncbi:hypothetical protein ABEB36_004726 [Hypothenemus hampei]|uniref:Uncharacterized protein n=1 Tax=Hypothenemus hampei TaxID=57062 RepID=A0ABD1F6V5_HYPHA
MPKIMKTKLKTCILHKIIYIGQWNSGGLYCFPMRPEYVSMVVIEEEKCTEDQESDFQNAVLKSAFLMEVVPQL